MVGQNGAIRRTTDGAVTWTSAPSGVTAHLRAVAFIDALTGWAAGDAGTILKTINGGSSWTAQTSGVSVALLALAARNANEAWAVGESGTILETSDGGTTWQFVDVGQGTVPLRGIAAGASPHGWIVGDDSALVPLEGAAPAFRSLPALSFGIQPGRYYVKGTLCEIEEAASFYNQPDRRVAERLTPGTHLAFLDVWQRHLSYLEEPRIREVALGGPDTASRGKTVWQLRTMPIDAVSPPEWHCLSEVPEWEALVAPSAARLKARAEPEQVAASLCELGAAGGFRRVENQLYRVEVHEAGAVPTFKWSRENGSVAFAIESIVEAGGQTTVTLARRGLDDNLDLVRNGWVEVVDDDVVLERAVGVLLRFVDVGNDPSEVVLDGLVGDIGRRPSRHPLLRRWDQRPPGNDAALRIEEGQWISLEDGVEVFFEPGGSYRPGEYWEIPARTISGDVEWPRDEHGMPVARGPAGIKHHYCRVAILEVAPDGTVTVVSDCRLLFPPVTAMTQLEYVSGDGQDGIPGNSLPQPLRVRVVRGEHPVENAIVRFDVTQGQGRVDASAPDGFVDVLTLADGVAECAWTLDANINAASRHQSVQATLLDAASSAVPGQRIGFHATATLTLSSIAGDGQEGPPSATLPHPLEVRVANGQTPVAGRQVHYQVFGGGSLTPASPVATLANGVAQIDWVLGAAGAQRVEAEIRDAAGVRVQHVAFNATIRQQAVATVGCELTVGPGGDLDRLDGDRIESLLQERGRLCLCLLPGEHKVDRLNVEMRGFLTIHGCGPGTILHILGPSQFVGLSYVELAGFSIQYQGADGGIQFVKCSEVALRRMSFEARNGYNGSFLDFLAVPDVTIDACTTTEGDVPETRALRWSAIVFRDAFGVKRITDSRIRGMVALYGPGNEGAEFARADLEALLKAFTQARVIEATGGIVFDNNVFERITIADAVRMRILAMLKGGDGAFNGLFRSATLVGNRILDRRSIVFTELAALAANCLDLRIEGADVLATFLCRSATVTGTVSNLGPPPGAAGPRNELWVLSAIGRCFESANAVVVRHL
jgi:hypothetical protein